LDRVDPFANRGVQIREREKRPVAQHRQDPALDDLDTDFDFGLVGRRGDAGGNHHGAIVAGEVGVRAVHLRLVAARGRDAALQIVRDPDRRTALKVVEHPDVRADPRRQVLAPRGLGVDQAARAEHADEEFDRDVLPSLRIDQVRALPGEIDKQLLAGAMHLPHRRLQRPRPAAVPLTKLAVGVAVRRLRAILLPQQRQRHAGFLQFLMQRPPVRHDPWAGRRRPRKHPRLQRGVIEVLGERPGQASRRRALQVAGHRPQAHRARVRNRAVAQTDVVLQTEEFAESSHQ
jgi:hypothetical protein